MVANDYSGAVYVNLANQARAWENAPLNQFGYPTSLPNGNAFSYFIINDQARADALPKGDYVLLWDGQGTFSVSGGGYTETSNTASGGRAIVNYQGGSLTISMTSLVRPHTSIKLLMPGTEATHQTQPFHEKFLKRLKWATSIRCMDWLGTNANPCKTWDDRMTLQHFSQSLEKQRNDGGNTSNANMGTSVEYTAMLANELHRNGNLKSLWLNVPAAADDNYITQMATYFRNNNNLDSTLKLIIEHSNEPWNYASAFKQGFDFDAIGRSVAGAGLEEWRYRLIGYGHRAPEVMKIWRDVWGSQASRLTCVANLQVNNAGVNDIMMKYQHPTLGVSGSNFDAFATAPYFDGDGLNDPSTPAKMQSILNRSRADTLALMEADAIRSATTKVDNDLAWIASNFPNKKLLIYECQQHVIPNVWPDTTDEFGNAVGSFAQSARGKATAKFLEINNSVEMKAIIKNYLTTISQRLPGSDICFFTFDGPGPNAQLKSNEFGFWKSNFLGDPITSLHCGKLAACIEVQGLNPANYN